MAVAVSSVHTERFHVPVGSCLFQSQFAAIYLARLKSSRPRLSKLASNRWPKLTVRSLADVEPSEECVIIGTIFRVSYLCKISSFSLYHGRLFSCLLLVMPPKTEHYQATCTVRAAWRPTYIGIPE